jgi:transcription-repair coupling factor (superfamily II helicase)
MTLAQSKTATSSTAPSAAASMTLSHAPEGMDALVLAGMAAERDGTAEPRAILHIARDDRRLEALEQGLKFFAPETTVIAFPAWDVVPYDRVSPNSEIVSRRISALTRLIAAKRKGPLVVVTTVNALLQKVPPRSFIRESIKPIAPGQRIDTSQLVKQLERAGFGRVSTVMEHGDYAVRGGIIDLFPPGRQSPVRLDFFGDTLESIKPFDPETQRTAQAINKLTLLPVSEVAFGAKVVSDFRRRYVELFGAVTSDDPLYESISAGARYHGMEHWLPLFHAEMETLVDYVPDAILTLDHSVDAAIDQRLEQIKDHYLARAEALEAQSFGAPPYKPVPPQQLYFEARDWRRLSEERPVRRIAPFDVPPMPGVQTVSMGGKQGRNFSADRQTEGVSTFDAVVQHIRGLQGRNKRVLVAAWTNGARERLAHLLEEHGIAEMAKVENWPDALKAKKTTVCFAELGMEHGIEAGDFAILAEQDILGDRLVRPRRKSKKASDVLTEATSLGPGDFVVHVDHGIGRFIGLNTVTAAGAPHDCLEVHYHGGDKLFLPVENIELLSRYGSDSETVQLDRLGGAAWQARKARMKSRILEMAEALIRIAAIRMTKTAEPLIPPPGLYEEFAARFPYDETEDQASSIDAVVADLQSGRPMDRLVCGDVGFGKTEVAIRAAFVAVMGGKQVAVVVPTTLLARQHYKTFMKRFDGVPVRIGQASRLVPAKELADVKQGMKDGAVEIVVGTHALLAKGTEFKNLGLLIIDEEQHFGVQHKERLKQLSEDVHVLTLTATPIPRTLQLALTGVRELSLITTPPVDRLAVRSFVAPFDPVILKEALLRERYRGGQTFYVCPRISDLDEIATFLAETVPDLRVARAHGQMAPGTLDDIMTAFYEGQYDVLLSTTIVESGLDVPNANTLIIHRADMFGLAQLYQLRGRVGRSKVRAYAYFTVGATMKMTEGATKRLKVLQSLDTLGAGFSLATHDLDLRGGGNLLGQEQSGHIREVGYELYQSMLEEAIANLKSGGTHEVQDKWSPQISIGTAVMLPESYITDLDLRLGLYRRLSTLEQPEEIEAFAAELVDRFGPLPVEVQYLLEIVQIKGLCRRANVSHVDAGPKGVSIAFRNKTFANPDGLVKWLKDNAKVTRVQPDQKIVYLAEWPEPDRRLKNTRVLIGKLADLAEMGGKPQR